MNKRIYKINELIKNEISKILLKEVDYPKGFITVSAVETTADLRQAVIWFLVVGGDEQEAQKLLSREERSIQKILNSRLSLRHVPRITFKVDHSGEYASNINKLIEKAHEDKNQG